MLLLIRLARISHTRSFGALLHNEMAE